MYNKKRYSTYNNGLRKGDLVNFDLYDPFFGRTIKAGSCINCTILNRRFLFAQQTRYGLRTFWEYEGLYNNKVIEFRTQEIKVKRVISSSE